VRYLIGRVVGPPEHPAMNEYLEEFGFQSSAIGYEKMDLGLS